MAMTLKLTTVGNSTGVIHPEGVVGEDACQTGDLLHVLETPAGITADAAWTRTMAAQMDVAETIMRKRRTLLRKLAE